MLAYMKVRRETKRAPSLAYEDILGIQVSHEIDLLCRRQLCAKHMRAPMSSDRQMKAKFFEMGSDSEIYARQRHRDILNTPYL